MPKSRNQLINEITQARKDAKAKFLYVSGLTKMKKDELRQIHKELNLQEKRVQKYDDDIAEPTERELYERDEFSELEKERDRIKAELESLEEQEDIAEEKKIELEELSDDDVAEESEESEEEEAKFIKEKLKPAEESEEETILSDEEFVEEQPKKNTKELQTEVRTMLKHFSKNIKEILDEFRGLELTDEIENEIIDYHNEQREIMKSDLESVYRDLGDKDFSDSFYKQIDKAFDTVMNKVDKYLQ